MTKPLEGWCGLCPHVSKPTVYITVFYSRSASAPGASAGRVHIAAYRNTVSNKPFAVAARVSLHRS